MMHIIIFNIVNKMSNIYSNIFFEDSDMEISDSDFNDSDMEITDSDSIDDHLQYMENHDDVDINLSDLVLEDMEIFIDKRKLICQMVSQNFMTKF